MSPAAQPISVSPMPTQPLAERIACDLREFARATPGAELVGKLQICLMDFIGCAFESRELPWARQAKALAEPQPQGATVIGRGEAATVGDAAFANAVMGHGLVREDMHPGSISHLGITVLPALLALSQTRRVSGRKFINAAVVGYETGGQIGRALMDAQLARIHRPTGVTGPIAAAAAGALLCDLTTEQTTSAIALGANCTAGFNQWAHTGGSEMFFQAGAAARNAVTAVRLAESGAFASPTALDGEAGLFAALGKRAAASRVRLFHDTPEILSVYHKPVPACNFAQTPSLAALQLARAHAIVPQDIADIRIRTSRAATLYPGCDARGPFTHVLQGKMSIQFNVAAALIAGEVSERNFTRLDDTLIKRLIDVMQLEVDAEMTQAYPGKQGAEVEVRLRDGRVHSARLDDVVNADATEVRTRFRHATAEALGAARAEQIEACIEELDSSDDAGHLAALLRG